MKSTLPRAANDADVNSKNCVKSCIMNRERERESAHVASQGSVNARGCCAGEFGASVHMHRRETDRPQIDGRKQINNPSAGMAVDQRNGCSYKFEKPPSPAAAAQRARARVQSREMQFL